MNDFSNEEANRKSLRISMLDGVFACIAFGFTANYNTPFALLLGANSFFIGLLNSIPQLLSAIVQLKSTEVAEFMKSRVRTITISVFMQAASWLLTLVIIFLPGKLRVETFILLVTLNSVVGSISAPVWNALMSDTVDKDKYGSYFSWRGRILGFVSLASTFGAGFFLFAVKDKMAGFLLLFVTAGLCRSISGNFVRQMREIPVKTSEEKRFNYIEFIRRIKESNFVKFVLFVSLINFTTFLAAPFFSVYLLKELHVNYSMFTIITTSGSLAGLLILPFWGRYSDKFGNAKIIKTTSKFLGVVAMLWIVSKNPYYLIAICAFGGYIWAGFNLSAINFIFDIASPEVRTRCISYFNFTNGIFIFLGAIMGGWLATHIPPLIDGSSLLTLFMLSGILRTVVAFSLVGTFKEIRPVSDIEDREMFYITMGIKPVLTLGEEIFYRKKKQPAIK